MFTKLNRRLILFVIAAIALSTLTVTAQENIWSANTDSTDSIVKDKAVARQSFPTEFRLFNLNVEPLKAQLMSITDQPVALTGNSPASTVILIPNADGVLERFEVFEASNFDAELQEEFPQIRAFSGRGLDDRRLARTRRTEQVRGGRTNVVCHTHHVELEDQLEHEPVSFRLVTLEGDETGAPRATRGAPVTWVSRCRR